MKKAALFFLAFFCVVGLAKEPVITVSVSKNKCALGDKVEVEVKVVGDFRSKPEFSVEKNDDDKIVYSDFKTEEQTLENSLKMDVLRFFVQPFKLGKIELGKITVKIGEKDYQKQIPSVEVVSILPKDKKDVNPLKPQLSVKPDYSYLKKYALYGLAFLIIALALFFLARKIYGKIGKREKLPEKEEIILEPPCEEVKKLVASLLKKSYLKEGRVKEFFVELSEIGKRFLGRVYRFDYESKTSEEIFLNLKGKLKTDAEFTVKEFFNMCDLVKFAKYKPSQSEINATVNLLYQFAEKICNEIESEKEQGVKDVQV